MDWKEQLNKLITVHYQGRGAMTALADHIGVAKGTMYDWINGANEPNDENRESIDRLYKLREGSANE